MKVQFAHVEFDTDVQDTHTTYWVKIYAKTSERRFIEVGAAVIIVFSKDLTGYDLVEVANEVSMDAYAAICSVIVDGCESTEMPEPTVRVCGQIAVLDRLKINRPYRNQGVGTDAIKSLLSMLREEGVDYVITKPYSLDFVGREDETAEQLAKVRLISLGERLGFERTLGYMGEEDLHLCKHISHVVD